MYIHRCRRIATGLGVRPVIYDQFGLSSGQAKLVVKRCFGKKTEWYEMMHRAELLQQDRNGRISIVNVLEIKKFWKIATQLLVLLQGWN